MGECFFKLITNCEKSFKDRKQEQINNFKTIKEGFKESIKNFDNTLELIQDWDQLMNLKDKDPESQKLMRNKTIKEELKRKADFFLLLGLIFCIVQLMGVQLGIIILEALFSEILDEIKLWVSETPRKHNFYEKIQINSYKNLPEVDVGMVTSSIGIMVLKQIGFKASNSIFQLISSIIFGLLLFLFYFHTGDKLLENYTRLEITVLILSYIILSILVGCSSTIALKEYFQVNSKVFNKYNVISKKKKTENKIIDKMLFYFLSALSLIFIILINRKIFKSFKNKTSKWLRLIIVGIIFLSFFLSLIFHSLFIIPVVEKNKQKENNENEDNKIDIKINEREEDNKYDTKKKNPK